KGIRSYFPSVIPRTVYDFTLRKPVGLGSVTMGDFYGIGDVTPIFEVKYDNNGYGLFNSKNKTTLELDYLITKDLYSGRALFNNKISENDVLFYTNLEYLGEADDPSGASNLIDKFTFKISSLSPAKQKTAILELPGGLKEESTIVSSFDYDSYTFEHS